MNSKSWLMVAGGAGAIGVMLGAFGAHGLPGYLEGLSLTEEDLTKRLDNFEIAVRYHIYHALALFGVALSARFIRNVWVSIAGWSFLIGTLLFSGLLYAHSLSGVKIFGMIVPLGGTLLIVGWIAVVLAAIRDPGRETEGGE